MWPPVPAVCHGGAVIASSAATRAALTLLLLVGLAGCSGDADDGGVDGGPVATTVEQFCGGLRDYQADLANADPTDPTAYVGQLKAAAVRLESVGTPKELPADAVAGLDTQQALITALPDDPTPADLAALDRTDPDDQAGLDAFDTYVATSCPSL